jgi:hypothetical protein
MGIELGSSARRTRAARLGLIALLVGVLAGTSVTGPSASAAPRRDSGPSPSGYDPSVSTAAMSGSGQQAEGERFSGDWALVTDPEATGGTAVVLKSGVLSASSSLPAGHYLMSARVRSAGARIVLGVNNAQVGAATLAGGWTTTSAPVYLSGSTGWGLMAVARTDGKPNQPLYVDWLSLEPTTSLYTTIGTKILDRSGTQVTPRGVNRDGFQFKPQGNYWLSDNDFQAMYMWGATMIRLPLNQQYWLNTSCEYDPTYAQRVDQAVESITKRGMIALVTLQRAADGKACAPGYLSKMADDNSIPYWTQVASRYKSNPLVAFDIFNEPGPLTDEVWRNGGMVDGWHAVGMQQLYNTVRATGARNLVFISGTYTAFAIDVALRKPVDGYGIIYATHLYNPPEIGPLREGVDRLVTPVVSRYPVVITEFGSSSGSPLYNQTVIDYAAQHGIGWTAWKWYELPSEFGLLGSFRTYTPSPGGAPVQNALLQGRGWVTPGGQPPPAPLVLAP